MYGLISRYLIYTENRKKKSKLQYILKEMLLEILDFFKKRSNFFFPFISIFV